MTALKNDRLLRALLRQPVDQTPIWIMRQAGRYLPEYRATRERSGGFLKMCKTPEIACEITLQPLTRFDLDAAIIFSDILTIPDAMGLGLRFTEGEGPSFEKPLRGAKDILALPIPDPEDSLRYVTSAIRLTRQELDGRVPLIGFSGSPWTLATYMVAGKSDHEFTAIKTMLREQPALLHQLLDKLASAVTLYLNAQIAAGAQAVMIFDTWGGILSARDYQDISLQYCRRIFAELTRTAEQREVPRILFTKNGGQWLETMADSGCHALGIDWTCDISKARLRVGKHVALQGNMNPDILYAAPERIREEAANILAAYGRGPGHVFNLGHGIHRDVIPEHVAVLVKTVHELSKAYHS